MNQAAARYRAGWQSHRAQSPEQSAIESAVQRLSEPVIALSSCMGRNPRAPVHQSMKSVLLLVCLLLTACDQIAELDGSKAAEADGKAVGGACRHAGRALEDCYVLNERAPKAAVFNGWREMNDYMTQNKIDVVPPQVPRKAPAKDETAGAKHDAGAAKNDGAATNALPSADPSPTGVRPDKRTGPAIEGRVEGRAASAAQSALHSGASEIPGPAVAAALPPGFPGSAAAPAVPAR